MDTLMELKSYIPGLQVELRYATENNFTGKVIYAFAEARLRKGTADKLAKVQQILQDRGLGLKVWDAYRPAAAQFVLWETVPDPRFVADPTTGYSNHSRGNAVDLTIIDEAGNELEMPTAFDDFSSLASRAYTGISETARHNALLLEKLMVSNGFVPNPDEWWHFDDVTEYPVYMGIGYDIEREENRMDKIFENIKTRRSIRAYSDRKIDRKDLEKIVEAGAWAPTGMNRQTFQFTVVSDRAEIAALAKAAGQAMGNPEYDFYCPDALVLVSNLPEGTNPLADTACAMQNMFLQAHAMGIGSVWINQLKDVCDDAAVRAKLDAYGVPAGHKVWATCALGYAAGEAPAAPERKAVIKFVD